MNLASATFSGKIARIAPSSSKYVGEPADRPWIIWLEVELKKNSTPVLIRFVTKQKPIPYLISEGRIYEGFELTVMGSLSSVSIPTMHNGKKICLYLSEPTIPITENLFYKRTTTYVPTDSVDPVFA